MALALSLLAIICTDAGPGTSDAQTARVPSLPSRLIGKLLVWSVEAGMTPEQVKAVFGEPEASEADDYGPPRDWVESRTCFYPNYGITVTFSIRHRPPFRPGHYIRVEGTLE
jgi:hypothetical protein